MWNVLTTKYFPLTALNDKDIKIIRKIGAGQEGEVFEALITSADHGSFRVVVKKQKSPAFNLNDLTQAFPRELYFVKNFANKQVYGFMHMYAWKIAVEDYKYNPNIKNINPKTNARMNKYKYTLTRVYSYHEAVPINNWKDFTLNVIIHMHNLYRAGYTHNDMHPKNIVNTSSFPVVVDYGLVLHKSFPLNKWEIKTNNEEGPPCDCWFISNYIHDYYRFKKYTNKHNIVAPRWKSYVEFALQSKYAPHIFELINNLKIKITHKVVLHNLVAMMIRDMHQEVYNEFALGAQHKHMKLIKPYFKISEQDWIKIHTACLKPDYTQLYKLISALELTTTTMN